MTAHTDTPTRRKLTTLDFQRMKQEGEKIVWLTAYDYPSAYCCERGGVDLILVGDSGGMTVLGYSTTNPVTMDEMITLAKAARRGAPNTFIVGDMPQGSYEVSEEEAVRNALRFVKEAGCDAIKLEGSSPRIIASARAIGDAGITVFGHLGLTPQTAAAYKVQGATRESMLTIYGRLTDLEKVAPFVLLEAIPEESAAYIAKRHPSVMLFGIGAGAKLDGQLLIYHDLVGYYPNFKPRFAKNYVAELLKADTSATGFIGLATEAVIAYADAVRAGTFPDEAHTYPIKDEAFKASLANG